MESRIERAGGEPRTAEDPAAPRIVIEPRRGFVPIDLPELWRYREMVGYLALQLHMHRLYPSVFQNMC